MVDALDLSPYAGRWVALSGTLVAGVSSDPVDALRLAQRNRPKDRFTLRYVESEGEHLTLPPLLARLRPFFQQQEFPIYLVGGAVRDALLGQRSNDLDFIVPQQAIRLAFQTANALDVPAYAMDRERDVGRVVLSDEMTMLDFACFRGGGLDADLWDRDFTINALAMPATAVTTDSLIDPTGGVIDLAAGVVRQVRDGAVLADPVRGLRGLRLALKLGFTLEAETLAAIAQASQHLDKISPERVRDELLKLLQTAVPDQAITQMAATGWLTAVLPEIADLEGVTQSLPHHEDVGAHTVSVLRWLVGLETAVLSPALPTAEPLAQVQTAIAPFAENLADHWGQLWDGGVSGSTLLRLGALFHDVGKKETQTMTLEPDGNGRYRFLGHDKAGAKIAGRRLRRLAISNKANDHVKLIVAHHMRPLHLLNEPGTVSRRTIYRYFRATGPAGLDIGLLAFADHLATYGGIGPEAQWMRLIALVSTLYQHYFERHEETVAPLALVNGRDLMQTLHLEAGPELGRILRLIQEAQAAGDITSREEALDFAQKNA